jgi:F-type H+-transporting ATPase subunit delta
MNGAIAKRYAKAIFALASETSGTETMGQEIARLAEAFRIPEVAAFGQHRALDRKTRRAVTARVAEALRLSKPASSFLALLAENNRLPALAAIQREYEKLEDRRLGRIRARVRSAIPLSEGSHRRLREIFERQTGKKIIAESSVDAELLGGVTVELAGRVYDGSLRSRLERLRQSLRG